jgi:hypothetical protein
VIYEVYKSNRAGEWYAGRVEAGCETDALADAKRIYASRNATDLFRVTPLTPEREEQLLHDEAERAIRNAGRPARSGYSQRCLDRKMAYLSQCEQNIVRSQARLTGGVTLPNSGRVIEQLAEKFERDHPIP